jgi:hypothetical protein
VGNNSGDAGYFVRGFYFSANFNTSAAYAVEYNSTGNRTLLLCKVLVGKDKLIPSATPTPPTHH